MLQTVKTKIAKLSNYPRLRILLIIIAIIVVFVIVMNLLTPSTLKQDATEQQTIKSGGSVFQNAVQNAAPDTNITEPPAVSPQQFAQQQTNSNEPLSKQIGDLQQQLNAQQAIQNQQAQQRQAVNEQIQSIQSSMRTGLQNVSNRWKLPTLSTVEGSGADGSGSGSGATFQPPVAIKAGTILFGVVDTALDSDSPGTPVLATIVTGPYKGARLLGGFTASKNALVVQFNLMTLPNMSSSISINAYAIDAKTANNAIATNVDNHYLLRYGMLFASAFLQGFGSAYQNYTYCPPGTQNCSVINTNGTSNLPNNNVTTKTAAYQGLGQVGRTLGQAAAAQFNTPPTITVAQGTGVGILFMSDVRMPLNQ